jgi:N-acetyl sugar amidotransferase
MDTNGDPDIRFDAAGICNYCKRYDLLSSQRIFSGDAGRKKLDEVVSRIKAAKKSGATYDCILGVSGGVDSTYTAVLLKELGLNPLLVHLDNGWNSETAVRNIASMAQKLDFDLFTHVVNWEEFRDIQLSFVKASVVDIELVSDYAIVACLYNTAYRKKIPFIISGHNYATEAIMPASWIHEKGDLRNLLSIHKRFGKMKIKTFPVLSYFRKAFYVQRKKIKVIPILNYVDYHKDQAKKIMKERLDWQDYGLKHGESVFTRFYQNYMLPEKFNIDKRKAHLSSLICSGQMSREQALAEMQKPLYEPNALRQDKEYVIKKFGMTEKEFADIMKMPVRKHLDYPSYLKTFYKWEVELSKRLKPITKPIKKLFNIQVEGNYV